jgi:nitrite reductase/ring-hydroxylating ferredoxin subunit
VGEFMRQYWIPAASSSELKAGGAPVRFALLGEKLIAFRTKAGDVGVMDHRCPHRGASLFFGRNEEDGIRCVYHGWKFSPRGDCLDMPNVCAEQSYAHKVRAKAYRVVDRYGLIWVYMGPRAEPPPLPSFGPLCKPEDETQVFLAQRECNWLQSLEGDIDIGHFAFLHLGNIPRSDLPGDHGWRLSLSRPADGYEIFDSDWGTTYGANWATEDNNRYWKVCHFAFPFWTIPCDGTLGQIFVAHATVPMDDSHTMRINLTWPGRKGPKFADGRPIPGLRPGPGSGYLPNTTEWFGRWRLASNGSNDYHIDREVQQTSTYTGIDWIYLQDQAITESIGGSADHSREHLGPSDQMIIRTRKRLARAVRKFAANGAAPSAVDNPECFRNALGGGFVASSEEALMPAYARQVRNAAPNLGKEE